jgi:multiple sugar transport system permease protein
MATNIAAQSGMAGQKTALSAIAKPAIQILSYAVLIGVALALILPFIYSAANSLKTLPDINAAPMALLPNPELGVSTAGYNKILTTNLLDFPRALFNSLFVAVIVTVCRVVLNSMAGYALARIKFAGRGLAFAALIGTLMVPGIVLLIPRFMVLKQLGLTNTYFGLFFPLLADAFGIFLMKQFFESIPGEIEEAASMDGCSRIRMFFVIIMPMAVPALTALAIFSFQGSWNEFTTPLIAVSDEKSLYTLPLALAFIRGATGNALPWDILLAGAVITTLPMALVFFFFQRFFVESVNYTAVKG